MWQQVHILCCYVTDTSKTKANRTNNCLYLATTATAHQEPKVASPSASWQGPMFRTGCSRCSSNSNYGCSSLLPPRPWVAGSCLPRKDTQFKTAILHSAARGRKSGNSLWMNSLTLKQDAQLIHKSFSPQEEIQVTCNKSPKLGNEWIFNPVKPVSDFKVSTEGNVCLYENS